jgi:chemotaxis protein methyltransferase CheR
MLFVRIMNEEFRLLADFIERHYGIHLKEEKKLLVVTRLQQLLQTLHINSFSEYYHYLLSDRTGHAQTALLNHITTNHTFFMREADHFYYFRDHVLPFLRDSVGNHDLRIWSAGCSTGEEPYTLSMIINDFWGKNVCLWDTQLLATDISERVLQKARAGRYSAQQIAHLPFHWKHDYFKSVDAQVYEMKPEIKASVIFRKFNLMLRPFPFKQPFHVIFCRNVMIYFSDEVKHALIQQFYDHTAPGGFLFIGHSEALIRSRTRYRYVAPSVFRK